MPRKGGCRARADAAQGVFLCTPQGERRYDERGTMGGAPSKTRNRIETATYAARYDDFERVVDFDNLYRTFLDARRGVAWKESVQRYEANALRNTAETRRKLLAGESVQRGFAVFTLHERGKVRHIKSVHISERVIQKCLCDQAPVPLLSNGLVYDNGASVKGKGVRFALRRLIAHLSKFYRSNGRIF
jgi:hypothetical protein